MARSSSSSCSPPQAAQPYNLRPKRAKRIIKENSKAPQARGRTCPRSYDTRSVGKSSTRDQEDDETAKVLRILKQDGISESDVVYAKALNMCKDRYNRRWFLLLKTREGRLHWVMNCLDFSTSQSSESE